MVSDLPPETQARAAALVCAVADHDAEAVREAIGGLAITDMQAVAILLASWVPEEQPINGLCSRCEDKPVAHLGLCKNCYQNQRRGSKERLTPAQLLHEYHHFRGYGYTDNAIAELMGMHKESFRRALQRAGVKPVIHGPGELLQHQSETRVSIGNKTAPGDCWHSDEGLTDDLQTQEEGSHEHDTAA